MTARDDDELDGLDGLEDPALTSMRSVWLSMRDEEPPAAGLESLLAAARAKAVEMQPREPFWRRALAALRRPPVLALATVVVLIGGAVVLGDRREAFDAMPSAAGPSEEAVRQASAPNSAAAADVRKLEERAEPAREMAAGSADTATPAELAEPDEAEQLPVRTNPRPRRSTPTVAPAGRPPAAAVGETTGAGALEEKPTAAAELQEATAPAPAKPPALEPMPMPAPPATPQPASPQPASPPKKRALADDNASSRGGGKAPAAAGDDASIKDAEVIVISSSASASRGPSLAQLAQQSQTAAARGDCAAVRSLAAQIQKLDAAFHKRHVDGNAAVARCLK